MGNRLEAQLPMLRRIARSYALQCSCDPEDLLHEAVLDILEHLSRFDPERGSFTAFCRVWGLRGVRQAIARRGRCTSSANLKELPDASEVEAEEALDLAHALEQLPEKARRVIVMRFADAMAQAEVAGLLGLSRDSVYRLERDAVRSLKIDMGSRAKRPVKL